MTCPRCQHENRPQAKFCEECAAPLAGSARTAAPRSPDGASSVLSARTRRAAAGSAAPRFASPESYTPKHLAEKILTSKAALEGERKQVTVLFADLKGSMELLADRDPEEARKLLDPVLERMMEAVHRYEGTVNQVMGDGIMALFGAPLAHEDHAVRACYAALRMQEAVAALRRGGAPRARRATSRSASGSTPARSSCAPIGSDLHMDYTAVGQTTHLAARMEQLATPGTILLTADDPAARRGLRRRSSRSGPVPVKGLAEPVEVYELTGRGPGAHAPAGRRRARADALRRPRRRAGAAPPRPRAAPATATARSSPSSASRAWASRGSSGSSPTPTALQGWLVLESALGLLRQGHALPARDRPAQGLLRDRGPRRPARDPREGDGQAARRSIAALGADAARLPGAARRARRGRRLAGARPAAAPPAHARRASSACCCARARCSRCSLVFEDLHWIDGETQALLDSLVESLPTARAPAARQLPARVPARLGQQDLLQPAPARPAAAPRAPTSCSRRSSATTRRSAPLKQLLIERTEGNPFFLEESVRTLVETEALAGERGALPADAAARGDPGAGHRAGDPGGAHRPARRRRTSACSRRPSVIGKDVPFAAAPGDRRAAGGRRCARARRTCRPPSSSTRRGSVPGPRVHLQARAHPRGRLRRACSRSGGAPCTRASSRPSSDSTPIASPSRSSGSPTTPCAGELWEKAVAYLRQAGAKAMARSAYREAVAYFEQALAALAPPAREPRDDRSRPSTSASTSGTRSYPLGESGAHAGAPPRGRGARQDARRPAPARADRASSW